MGVLRSRPEPAVGERAAGGRAPAADARRSLTDHDALKPGCRPARFAPCVTATRRCTKRRTRLPAGSKVGKTFFNAGLIAKKRRSRELVSPGDALPTIMT